MGTPYHLPPPPSRFFPPDTASAEYKALSLITQSLEHPHRTILSAFVQQAKCKEDAVRFFLERVNGRGEASVGEFLEDWIGVLEKGLLVARWH